MSERKGTRGLELWCKRLVKDCPNVQIDNMTTSWRNGIAFCALIHHFRPDLIDVSKLSPENIYENNQLAFSIAEKELGIPALLDPEDMVENEIPDRLSILTYLSQFYRHLGHKVKTKSAENEIKAPLETTSMPPNTPLQFGKTGLDKCAACGLPVYLAQRLIVSHKLYHRRCFRCTNCSGHLNPKSFHVVDGSEFHCDSCKNEKVISKFLNNNDQMGMLAYNDDVNADSAAISDHKIVHNIQQTKRPLSILDKINMFEKGLDKEKTLEDKLDNITLKDTRDSKELISINSTNDTHEHIDSINIKKESNSPNTEVTSLNSTAENVLHNNSPEKVYKSNMKQFNFLQTQLLGDTSEPEIKLKEKHVEDTKSTINDSSISIKDDDVALEIKNDENPSNQEKIKEESNVTDDKRLENSQNFSIDSSINAFQEKSIDDKCTVSVPPRRKKQISSNKTALTEEIKTVPDKLPPKPKSKEYPDYLNPFADDENEDIQPEPIKRPSTNPFGSSDEEDDEVPPIQSLPTADQPTAPARRLITANPFWSDGEEPSSEEEHDNGSNMYAKSPLTTSTPNLPSSTPRRKKVKAPPPPPPALRVTSPDPMHTLSLATSTDDVASISSASSYNSTVHSDQKSCGKSTPMLKRKRLAPTPPDSMSTVSTCGGSMEQGVDLSGSSNTGGARRKGPAPGLPLPERREVKLQMSPEELQVQLDMLETQQLGLERQGVLIEQMIRQKCEGDEVCTVPQEEVEDLVIQLCEIVNEKNDLFRKQTELMYIRRQQRLEQEQADIEHEIRVLQSRPAVNRIDADKVREEQLVSRLVEIVRMRDELVQQLDAERRRERQEDLAIATSIANKRAQRNSDSSSMKSMEAVVSPKKNKMKDKVKKQLKKAKHTLIPKKKDDVADHKEEKLEKEKKSK